MSLLLLLQILTRECVEPYIVARLIEQHNLSTSWFFDTHAPKKQRLILFLSFFNPELGTYIYHQVWAFDHIDVHTSYQLFYEYPAENIDRNEISPKRLMQAVK